MKVHLEFQSETLADMRAEMEAFLGLKATTSAPAVIKANPIGQGLGVSQLNPFSQGLGASQLNPFSQRLGASQLNPIPATPDVATDTPAPSAADVVLGLTTEAPSSEPATASPSARGNGQTRSAADIALGLDTEEDTRDSDAAENGEVEELDDTDLGEMETLEDVEPVEETVAPPTEAEALLADKAQLNFDFDRVLASHGRTAALGIVRSVMPHGTKGKLKDLESLPVELIPAAIAALQAAETD
jgi:hypothetical protein